MRTILLGTWIGLIFGTSLPGIRGEEMNAQQRAMVMFPDVGRAGSSLNTRFLELYRRAVAERSEIFSDPEWPSILARKAAAQLADEPVARTPSVAQLAPVGATIRRMKPVPIDPNGPPPDRLPSVETREPESPAAPGLQGGKIFPRVRMAPLRISVPSADPPDFTVKGMLGEIARDWQTRMAHRLTVPGQIFTDAVVLPEEIPTTQGPGFWRRVGLYLRAVQRGNEAGLRGMMTPEAQEGFAMEDMAIGHRKLKNCTVLMVLQLEEKMVVFWRDRTMGHPPFVLEAHDGDYLVGSVRALTGDHQRLLRDIFWFLMVNPPKALIAKEK